jgi:alkanesulfonate monooxygenase
VAELLFPRLPLKNQPVVNQPQMFSPFGEIVANEKFPSQKQVVSPSAS